MDDKHFDGLAKIVASGGSRRSALRLLGGSALAAALTRVGLRTAAAGQVGTADDRDANCRGSCAQCSGDGQCCSGRCDGGVCKCKQRGSCAHDRACCSGRCGGDGRCKRATAIVCGDEGGLGRGTCGTNDNFCQGSSANCNGDPDCICSKTSGDLVCHVLPCAVCSRCNEDRDCRRRGFGKSSRCVPHDQCCSGRSSCLTPCGQDCVGGGGSRAAGVGYGR